MSKILLSTPEFGFIVATRAALALGVGLLVARQLDDDKRRVVGKALVAGGALATIPAALFLLRSFKAATMKASRG